MDKGYRFMQEIVLYPVEENKEKLLSLPDIVEKSGVKLFFSPVQRTTVSKPIFRLREGLIDNLLSAAREMNKQGWVMKIEDAFRTTAMQNPLNRTKNTFDAIAKIILWECEGKIPDPEFFFRRMTVLIATIPKIATHMSGSAIDISVLSMKTGKEIDRGAGYLGMNEKTFMNSPFISKTAMRNRKIITEILHRYGFYAYPFEFWHYSNNDAFAMYLSKSGRPALYGPVDLISEAGDVKPIENPLKPLFELKEIQEKIEFSLKNPGVN